MAKRKGAGKGTGRGYKNLPNFPKDSKVHSDSARGRKQPQKIPFIPKPKPKKSIKYSDEEQMFIDRYSVETLNDFKAKFGDDVGIKEIRDEGNSIVIETDDGNEYQIFDSEYDAENEARDRIREDLEQEPSLFEKNFLENHIIISDTDRRLIAQEESDFQVDDLEDEEIIDMTDESIDYEEITDKIDDLQEKMDDLDESKENYIENRDTLQFQIDDLEIEREDFVNEQKENLRSDKYDEIYEELENPVNYFVEEQGTYTREQLLEQPFIKIDVDSATDEAISIDGWQHFLATYDGYSTYLSGERVIIRLN